MEFIVKKFNELSVLELYEILKLRCDVFIVEQNCPYNDIDLKDLESIHVMLKEDNKLIAYLRVLPKGLQFETVAIGRVISKERRKGNGLILLNKGIEVAKSYFNADFITIEAQTYAIPFYSKAGFIKVGDEFLEDGIPHYKMILDLKG